MTTKSKQAFEAKFKNFDLHKDSDGNYICGTTFPMYVSWQAAEAFARKQALEDAIALFNQPHVEHFGSNIVEMLEELLND